MTRITKRPSLPPDLKLTPEEGFVLSRIEGITEVRELEALTGLPRESVDAIVHSLDKQGAIEVQEAPVSLDPVEPATSEPDIPYAEPWTEPQDVSTAAESSTGVAAESSSALTDDDVAKNTTHRERWSTKFRGLAPERRRVLARSAESDDLLALAYDQDPQVLRAVIANPKSSAQVARIIAAHAQTSVALDALSRFANDQGVQRGLMRNSHTSDGMLRRLLQPKPLGNVYHAATDRDAAEVPRMRCKTIFRERFNQGQADEKAQLLLKTEGRVLQMLAGIPLDAKTTALLCSKTITSSLFVQNIARYSAAPPVLLLHLVRQPFVKRQPQLVRMLAQHSNMPREGKPT
jgi:hypothetical protein